MDEALVVLFVATYFYFGMSSLSLIPYGGEGTKSYKEYCSMIPPDRWVIGKVMDILFYPGFQTWQCLGM